MNNSQKIEQEVLNKLKKDTPRVFNEYQEKIKGLLIEAVQITKQEILKMIDEEITTQKKFLTRNLEKDKSVNWRIIGFEEFKKQLKEEKT